MSSVRPQQAALSAVRRFFATPKGLLTILLTILAAIAAPVEGAARLAPGLASSIAAAARNLLRL